MRLFQRFPENIEVVGSWKEFYGVVFPVVNDDLQAFHFGDMGRRRETYTLFRTLLFGSSVSVNRVSCNNTYLYVKVRLYSMVNNTISLNENASRMLNNIKEKYGLETDSEAIEFMAYHCIKEPELRPEYIEKMKEIDREESIRVPHGMGLLEYLDSLPDDDEDD